MSNASLKLAMVITIVLVTLVGCLLYFQQAPSGPPKPIASSLSLTITPSTIGMGKTTVFTGVLEEEEAAWRRISGKTIIFSYSETREGWKPIGSTVTDERGHYKYTWFEASSLPAGNYLIKASWGGDEKYLPSSVVAKLTVIEVTKLKLTVDPTSYCYLTDVEGEKVSSEFKLKHSAPWCAGKILKNWYSPFFRELGETYGFEPICCCPPPVGPNYGCCCHEDYWLVKTNMPGSLEEKPPGIYKEVKWLHNVLDLPPRQPDYVPGLGPPEYTGPPVPARLHEREKLHAQPLYAHSGDARNADPDYSLRIYLKYGSGNDVERWWYYGAEYPMWWKTLGMYGEVTYAKEVDYIADLGKGAVFFEWWAFRESKAEKLIDENHVGAYAMEVVVKISNTSTGKTYRLHYVHDIFNPHGKKPENTETDVYIYEGGLMPKDTWQRYSHNLSKDFYHFFNVKPSANLKITGIRLGTLWYKVSSEVTASIDFDDLKFTRYGVAGIPVHFVYNLTGCGEVKSILAKLLAQLTINGKVISSQMEEKNYPAPSSDLWSGMWDVTMKIPVNASLEYGKTYSSAKLNITVKLEAADKEGNITPLSTAMTITMNNIEWYNCITPTGKTTISLSTKSQ